MKTVYNDMPCKEPNSAVCMVWSSSSSSHRFCVCELKSSRSMNEINVFAFANEIPQGSQAIIISTALFYSSDGMNSNSVVDEAFARPGKGHRNYG